MIGKVGIEFGQNIAFPGLTGKPGTARVTLARGNQGILSPLAKERQVDGDRNRNHIAIGRIAATVGCADSQVGTLVSLG